MLFYTDVEPLSPHAHGQWRIADDASWGFAAHTNVLPLLGQELPAAQANYPIAFAATAQGQPLAVALVGSQSNRFVDAQGQWQNQAYIPAYVRRFPFALAGEGERQAVVIETSSGVVGPFAQGKPLFEGDVPSATLQQALGLVEAFYRQGQVSEVFAHELKRLGLLKAVTFVDVYTRDQVEGLQIVDEQAFKRLDDTALLGLFKAGFLDWVYAHLHSLKQLPMVGLALA